VAAFVLFFIDVHPARDTAALGAEVGLGFTSREEDASKRCTYAIRAAACRARSR